MTRKTSITVAVGALACIVWGVILVLEIVGNPDTWS